MINERAAKQNNFLMDVPFPITTEIRHILSETSYANRWAKEHILTSLRSFIILCG